MKRDDIQKKIDDWHKNNKNEDFDKKKYSAFLKSIELFTLFTQLGRDVSIIPCGKNRFLTS